MALQRVSSRAGGIKEQRGPPVLLQHGLFMVSLLNLFCCIYIQIGPKFEKKKKHNEIFEMALWPMGIKLDGGRIDIVV